MNSITIKNPIVWGDIPDPSVIRHEETFYMVSTSMHSMPGCPIMKSQNLKDWEIVNYVFDTLENNDAHNLIDGENIYGKGSWAASLRFHIDTFYVCFSSNDMNQTYIYQTKDLENGEWERYVIKGLLHDPSLLFENESVYVIYGNGEIWIKELTNDAKTIKQDGINQKLFETEHEGIGLRCEGCHAYKLNGYYYLFFIEWPSKGSARRRQLCYRSKELLGPYERRVILDDDVGYHNKGVAQGGIVDSQQGEWFAILFQDHDAVGRIPIVVPVTWKEHWPVFGVDGAVPEEFEAQLPKSESHSLVKSDEFNNSENKLALNWQWNHNPDNTLWSLTDRPNYLRLKTGYLTTSVADARNTLTQRTEGPSCSGITKLDFKRMKPGDRAGLVALQYHYGWIGIQVQNNSEYYVSMCVNNTDRTENFIESLRYMADQIFLKIDFNFEDSKDTANFYYSPDGEKWMQIGQEVKLYYTLDHFMGCRMGLFNYATKQIGGIADFDYFHYM
ncbi:glycosyl hydrolase 43 family protein [Gracilibacillus oryzae]|uniref:Glycosyl hydrolase 43 family protein n=1 Tax=Gracilibacillus oryzae TaxID=1672701 RepID=A0A7C8L6D2_9BACI|nr:glycoside hydrolase 43 family protein [Gracilibacillus oryzae]KAB8131061.1 glycosyl hydrolase 43 family protein [Gracilibacillus oryzae]